GVFEITSVTAGDAGTTISGNLTLKGISKNVTFNAAVNVTEDTFEILSDEFKINRTDWGINFMSASVFDDLKDKFIDDEIVLKVSVKGTVKK
ncbi:YceI family protein, partial [Arthrospira platensis SPKY1]|nr:YceI family protein [Arthrospira platensis SPKY1]